VLEQARFDLNQRAITCARNGGEEQLKLLSDHTYVLPSAIPRGRIDGQREGPVFV